MDFLPIAFLIVFVLLGGVIAVIADNLGRKIGKKKLTLHRRIRPRHSAMILTAVTGMIITLSTIALITIASSDVRAWILEGRRALQENTELVRRNQSLRTEQEKLLGANRALLGRTTDLQRQLASEQKKLGEAQQTMKTYEQKLRTADAELKAAISRAKSAADRAATISARLTGLQQRYTSVSSRLEVATKDLEKKRREYDVQQRTYATLVKEQQDLYVQNNQLDHDLSDKKAELEQKSKELLAKSAEIVEATKKIDELEAQQVDLEGRLRATQGDLGQAINELKFVKTMGEKWIRSSRYQPLMFAGGEELARVSVSASSSKQDVREMLDHVLATAASVAKDRGATSDENIGFAGLVSLDPSEAALSPEAQKDMLATELAGGDQDQVLIVFCRWNTFEKESVPLGINRRPNPLVFRQGQVIAEVRIDGRREEADMLKGLESLGIEIRNKALDKMIPVQGRDSSFGAITPEEILRLFSEIRDARREVRVQAIVKQPTRAGDPLLLTFLVR